MNNFSQEKFTGFPRTVRYVPVPAPLMDSLLEQIDDFVELKCTLRAIALLHSKKGHPRFVTLEELQADRTLSRPLGKDRASSANLIEKGMSKAVCRGTMAVASVNQKGIQTQVFAVNTEANREALSKISREGAYENTLPASQPWEEPMDTPNIFALYEQNVGLLSPIIADELREAEELYPSTWITEAIQEAVKRNVRNWRYIARILERWEHEGRSHGKPGRYSKKTVRY